MVLTIVFVCIILLLLHLKTRRPKNYPPGPKHYPIIGNAPQFRSGQLLERLIGDWRREYGPIVGLVLGPRKAIGVCGPREVLEVLQREEFQARHDNVFIRDRSYNKKLGIMFSDGPYWVEQRRFTLHHLRNFGFGKRNMELNIMEEAEDLIRDMGGKKIHEMDHLFSISTLNILWQLMAGTRYSRDDKNIKKVMSDLERFLRGGGISIIFNFLPFLRKFDPGFMGYTKAMEGIWKMQDFMKKTIREHQSTIDENSPRDFIDVYLIEMKKEANNPKTTFTEESLIVSLMDFFLGGSESVNSFLSFALMYMILNPEIQKKVQKELDTVIGRDRKPILEDRASLPYVEAVLTEVSRINPTSPLTPPHCAIRECTFNGYTIPEDTMVFVCLWNVFHDKGHWGDPNVFRPERFINAEGKFVKDPWMIPFGMGKRTCPGEIFARNTFFILFTHLLQEFWFSIPDGDPTPVTESLRGIVGSPAHFRVATTKRA